MKRWIFVTLYIVTLPALSGLASAAQSLGSFGSWESAVDETEGAPICYMSAVPQKSEGNYTVRDDTYISVTHRPADKSRDTVSITAGYEYKADSDVIVTIGQEKFTLFVQKDTAWTQSSEEDRKLVQAMRKGSTMVVVGYSKRGTKTTDTYSLDGVSKAYMEISKACNLASS